MYFYVFGSSMLHFFPKICQSVYDIINPFKICVHMATAAQQDSDNTVHAFCKVQIMVQVL